MSHMRWEPIKQIRCDRVRQEVILEARVVYPAEIMPDQPPRVLAHRCSLGMRCNLFDKPACAWAGTLPGYDPFN